MRYYRPIDVWERLDDNTLVRYRCFEILPIKRYCVQSKDFYRSPFTETADLIFETQFLELLLDMSPEERSGLYQSIEEAIEAHNRDFEREKTG